jgi:antitoxin ParD1/3/4
MTIQLKPELERLIQEDVERGPYQNVDEFVECAVQMLHEQEEWLSANRAEIGAKIEEGYASAQRGELIDDHEIRAQMEERKPPGGLTRAGSDPFSLNSRGRGGSLRNMGLHCGL